MGLGKLNVRLCDEKYQKSQNNSKAFRFFFFFGLDCSDLGVDGRAVRNLNIVLISIFVQNRIVHHSTLSMP